MADDSHGVAAVKSTLPESQLPCHARRMTILGLRGRARSLAPSRAGARPRVTPVRSPGASARAGAQRT